MTPQDKAIIKAPDGEMCIRASVIDGCGISTADFIQKKFEGEDNPRVRVCLAFIHEFWRVLGISIQTSSEEEFHKHLEKVWIVYNQKFQ